MIIKNLGIQDILQKLMKGIMDTQENVMEQILAVQKENGGLMKNTMFIKKNLKKKIFITKNTKHV